MQFLFPLKLLAEYLTTMFYLNSYIKQHKSIYKLYITYMISLEMWYVKEAKKNQGNSSSAQVFLSSLLYRYHSR